ncbi:MAG: hypothetical protein ACLGIN_16740 [Candidatus Sericytochromatia bacterium]
MKTKHKGWAAAVAGALMVAGLGCAQEQHEEMAEQVATPAAAGTVRTEQVVNPGPTLPKGTVEQRVASPNGQAEVVFMDEGESGDWFWRSLYVTSGAQHMDLGRYTELSEVKWSPEGDELTAQVKAGTDANKLTTYLLHYQLGAETYHLQELKVETVESAG